MFAQVIQGRTTDPEAVRAASERWMRDLSAGAVGWLGSTGGTTDDGRFVVVVRFEDEEAARRNSERPEQGQWWSETESAWSDATFRDSSDVTVDVIGDPDKAGFVQIMHGRVSDRDRAKELMATDSDKWTALRSEMLGMVNVGYDDGAYTMVIYFTSEAAAREGEQKEIPPDMAATMEEMNKLSVGEPEFFDLRQPVITSPS